MDREAADHTSAVADGGPKSPAATGGCDDPGAADRNDPDPNESDDDYAID